MPKKMGRPKLPKGKAKGHIVPVRFTERELRLIREAAALTNDQGVSEWIRMVVTAALRGFCE